MGEKREAATRDQNWYEFGRNMEYLNSLLVEAGGEKKEVTEVKMSFKKLHCHITSGKEVEYLSVVREFDRIFDIARSFGS